MSYYRICINCGDTKQVAHAQAAAFKYCRVCASHLSFKRRFSPEDGNCLVPGCGVPLISHAKCANPGCDILLGEEHVYQDSGNGVCTECAKTPRERAGRLEDNMPFADVPSGHLAY